MNAFTSSEREEAIHVHSDQFTYFHRCLVIQLSVRLSLCRRQYYAEYLHTNNAVLSH